MLIPATYLFTRPDEDQATARSRRMSECEWLALGSDAARPRFLGVDRAVASIAGIMVGIVAYGGLMDLIL